MVIQTRLKDHFRLDGLAVDTMESGPLGVTWGEPHDCGSHEEIVQIPKFWVADVGVRTDKVYDPRFGLALRSKHRLQAYTVEGAVFIHSESLFLGEEDYRLATVLEAACAFSMSRCSYGSLRARAFSSASLTLQVWKDQNGIIATADGSGPRHHLMYIPKSIPPQW